MEIVIYFLGSLVIALFCYLLFGKKAPFDAPMLGLLTLGLSLIAIVALKPGSMKFANVEISQMWTKTEQATRKAEKATDAAEQARVQAIEATAYLLWNTGRLGFGGKFQEKAARNVLSQLYGNETDKVVHALQRRRIFLTPEDELKKIPNDRIPPEILSRVQTQMGRWTDH